MTQAELILSHLKSGKPITPIEALGEYGVFRLGARIHDLKHAGHPIAKRMIEDRRTGKRFAEYFWSEAA